MNDQQAAKLPVYDGGDLGATWTPDRTVFRLWAPTAKQAVLFLYATGTPDEPGAEELAARPMRQVGQGVWQLTLPGNWDGFYYQYGLMFEDQERILTADPYAKACGANGARSMIFDPKRALPEDWEHDERPDIPAHARCVWETHVADFSADPHCGVPAEWRGKFMGFTPEDTTLDGDGEHPTCLNYLKRLGITHVQMMPMYDYATVDETTDEGYNWGYDPLNYNIPEGRYATDPYNGIVRLRECRAMIAALHKAGLGVIMDVVYNHTYHADSWLERTLPGYWNRRWDNDALTNGSGCGCDLATERTMVRKYIVDSIVYWAKEYHLDGFRFDLMACYDVETMNAIRAALDELPGGHNILMYGEPWQGGATRMAEGARPANKDALDALDARIGFFCDNTRDAIKGHVFEQKSAGYINGGPYHGIKLLHGIGAWLDGTGGFQPKEAGQVVQYVSAHDNLTLWDKLSVVAGKKPGQKPDPAVVAQNRMAAGIYLTCQGLPFMLSGEEFARSKNGDENSYRSPLSVNRIDWARTVQMAPLVEYYRGLLAIRRAYPELSGVDGRSTPTLIVEPDWLIGFVPESNQEQGEAVGRLVVLYNPEETPQRAVLPVGRWQMLSDGKVASTEPFGAVTEKEIMLEPTSVTILTAVS